MTDADGASRPLERHRPLRLRTADNVRGERHSSNMELFFDLVFAVAVTEMGETLVSRPTSTAMAHYAPLFVPVWWAWVGYTFYADRFDNDDVTYRGLMIAAMLATSWLAVAIPDAFGNDGGSIRFTLSYVVMRGILIILYIRAYRHAPTARPLIVRYVTGFGAGLSLWLASLLVQPPSRYLLWGAGLLFELAPPLVSAAAIRRVPLHRSHIPERFGNFVMIVLGEGGAVGALRIVTDPLRHGTIMVAAGGLLIAAAQWWLYFDCVDASPLRRWIPTGLTYVYGHSMVFGGLITTGVGVVLATRAAAGGPASTIGRSALCVGPAMFMLAIGVIHLTNVLPRGDLRAWSRITVGAAFLALAPLARGLPPLAIEVATLAALASQTALELRLPPCPHMWTVMPPFSRPS